MLRGMDVHGLVVILACPGLRVAPLVDTDEQVLCPRAIICPNLRAIVHLRPAVGHTTGTQDVTRTRFIGV
jgi:hypothetical protein